MEHTPIPWRLIAADDEYTIHAPGHGTIIATAPPAAARSRSQRPLYRPCCKQPRPTPGGAGSCQRGGGPNNIRNRPAICDIPQGPRRHPASERKLK